MVEKAELDWQQLDLIERERKKERKGNEEEENV